MRRVEQLDDGRFVLLNSKNPNVKISRSQASVEVPTAKQYRSLQKNIGNRDKVKEIIGEIPSDDVRKPRRRN
jgi:hypothetical protein